MATDYEPIAEQHKRAILQPWRTYRLVFADGCLVCDIAGKSLIDPACGEGHYARLIRKAALHC